MRGSKSKLRIGFSAVGLAVSCLGGRAWADFWIGNAGDWFDPSNWSYGVPGTTEPGDNLVVLPQITNSLAQVQITSGTAVAYTALKLGMGSITLSGGTLVGVPYPPAPLPGTEMIGGGGGPATFLQTGGVNYPDNYPGSGFDSYGIGAGLVIGKGTYDLEGGTIIANSETLDGGSTTKPPFATFIQNGGVNNVLGTSAQNADGLRMLLGTYNLNGGTLNAITENVNTSSTFIQTGGCNNVTGTALPSEEITRGLIVENSTSGTPADYLLSGGMLNANTECIGYENGAIQASTFVQTGGANTISGTNGNGTLYVGYGNDGAAEGAYSLSDAGVLSATSEVIGFASGNGTFTQSGGTNTTGTLIINSGNSGSYSLTGGTLAVSGSINIIISDQTLGVLSLAGGTASAGSVSNSGIVTISGPVGSNTYGNLTVNGNYAQSGGQTQVDGLLTIAAGSSLTLAGGTLSGSGMVAGDIVNTSGIVSPGDGTGMLTIAGNFSQGSAGVLNINVAGDPATLEFGALMLGEAADLDGTLDVAFLNGFVPTYGETFDFLTAGGGVSGEFASVDSPYTLAINYSPGGVSLTVVPEPSAIGLLAVGAGLLLRRRQKRIN